MNSQFNWQPRHYFFNFVLFNSLFFFLQLLYVSSINGSFLQALPLPLTVYGEIFAEIIVQICLYLLLSLLQTVLLAGLVSPTSTFQSVTRQQLLIYGLTLTLILSLNCYLFPLSVFSQLLLPALPPLLLHLLLILSSLIFFSLIVKTWWTFRFKKQWRLRLGGIIFIVFLLFNYFHHLPFQSETIKRPNIILIGIDSLSPESVNSQTMPILAHFLQESVHFTETISPLARTYPAWSSILTGLYPLHHFARENLTPKQMVKSKQSIVWKLRNLGYHTIFASDDRRFNNLDKDFGFDEIVGPKLGVNDFLLGSFYDFPLSNLLINSYLGYWLFPYNYINRASYYSYYPRAFDLALQNLINKNLAKQPIMLAVHFTLPHWPYRWAASPPSLITNIYDISQQHDLYQQALQKTDQQLGALLKQLQKQGLLNNSLLMVLSDHGETLYTQGSRITALKNYQGKLPSPLATYLKQKTSTTLQKSAGHGSDLLSPSQYQCLLGIKIFQHGQQLTSAKKINTRIALIDIAPTIYSFLNLAPQPYFEGISLLKFLFNNTLPPNNRLFMLESGMLANQFLSKEKARYYGQLFFSVNPKTNYLQLKPQQLPLINASKLYGAIQGNWLLTLYPNGENYITVIVRLKDHHWTDQMDTIFAQQSPFVAMLQDLRRFYQYDLAYYPKTQKIRKF